jgi:hypothetical protein
MAAILDRIVAATRVRVAESKRGADVSALERRAESHVPRGFRRALEHPHFSQKQREMGHSNIAVIAELRRRRRRRG